MKIAHATDIHWFAPPDLGHLGFKRVLGTANLYLRGRKDDFAVEVQAALVDHLQALAPDAVLISGDLTAQALPDEFDLALSALRPLLDRVPTLVLPGNHDVYAPDAVRGGFMAARFGPWMGLQAGPLARLELPGVVLLGLDPSRPTWITAAGRIPEEQLAALARALASPSLDGRPVVLGVHYPPVDRHGAPYTKASHGLLNAAELVAVLDAAPVRPALIACGHVHHGFRSRIVLSDGAEIPVLDCGSSGHAWQPARGRAAAMAVYEVDERGLVGVERWLHDGERFVPEAGGAFASGR